MHYLLTIKNCYKYLSREDLQEAGDEAVMVNILLQIWAKEKTNKTWQVTHIRA